MDQADEDFLTQLHRNLELRDLTPDDERYVPLQQYPEAVGPDAVRLLTRQITRSSRGSMYFLSGLRGSGKSTQLRRLREELARRGVAAVRLDAEEYLNLRQPLEVGEFLFFLVGGIADQVVEAGWLPADSPARQTWLRLREWLAALPLRVAVKEAGAATGLDIPGLAKAEVNVKAEIRRDESFVSGLRRFLDGRLSELADEANAIVRDLVSELRAAWAEQGRGDWQGLVVLVDSLDHVRGVDFALVRHALVDLFDKQSDTITLRDCRTVFIVPPYLQIDHGIVRRVCNVKVADRDREPFETGLEAMREVIRRRIPENNVARLIANPEDLDRLILHSGGNLRDLLRLLTEVEVEAEILPVDSAGIDRALQQVRQGLLPLAEDELKSLAHVAKENRAPLFSQNRWDELSLLHDRHLVLSHTNGEDWYDVHPLIRDETDRYS